MIPGAAGRVYRIPGAADRVYRIPGAAGRVYRIPGATGRVYRIPGAGGSCTRRESAAFSPSQRNSELIRFSRNVLLSLKDRSAAIYGYFLGSVAKYFCRRTVSGGCESRSLIKLGTVYRNFLYL